MKRMLSRAIMAVATCCMDENRQPWSLAMRGEFEEAIAEGKPLRFALGCLAAAWQDMAMRETGRFTLTGYALVLGVMLPMAAIQLGCALFDFPYLYPGQSGLRGAMLEGRAHEPLLRGVYQAATPSILFLQLLLAAGHFRIAWVMLERDWQRVARIGTWMGAATLTLMLFMSVLFLDCSRALFQAALLAIELATVALVAKRHAQMSPGVIPADR
ncbi:hypothetical protein [Sphingomonas sp.]|uniref:hypothetical protein n=1 Tax=Sphingomonas sp. TaxID=28214 RepID=UPI001EC51184|nr:hypothetical protein [Sphingomonas sp.]MBX3592952.1 hypothetical protein [Sphingomonas sp.]